MINGILIMVDGWTYNDNVLMVLVTNNFCYYDMTAITDVQVRPLPLCLPSLLLIRKVLAFSLT